MNGDLVIAMMGLFAIVFTLVVLAKFGQTPAKLQSQATVKSQAPTEEELLLAMSNTELLREIVRNQRQMLVVMKSTNRRSGLGLLGFLNVFRLLSDDSE